ncbi:MAG: Chromosome (Plasmid) partitioning protein ParA / Sporulation initiation inhibitor protein Soj [uncultured Sulfurovum sp.]|uniref:Chromosome (Plasmid) partitioning protein ParA / Sporulation initiation inhibitor protein Soj n=1 Tax=uncultured Sulfurovum sp. TaxID=269237 RepID=A0A6S6SIK8_9BACT|nr:MAG: Chromosome (Plasmid) partitioning protein ParA / Sporulation initiation inhibitor protein Soj [uncultured Sulfurovum sp.]
MSKIITVLNRKGGVSKTTTSRNIASIYVSQGKKVLLIDFDAQASLTKNFGLLDKDFEGASEHNICNIFTDKPIKPIDIGKEGEIYHILPSNKELERLGLDSIIGKDTKLKNFIEDMQLLDFYDVIIIDNNPAFNTQAINSILASDIIMVPVEPAKMDVEGLHGFLESTEETLKAFRHKIEKIIIIPSKYEENTRVAKDYLGILNEYTETFIKEKCPILSQASFVITKPVPKTVIFKSADGYNKSTYDYMHENKSQISISSDKVKTLIDDLEKIAAVAM